MTMNWSTDSWRNRTALQLPAYEDEKMLKRTIDKLATHPPLVFAGEVRDLKAELSKVARGEAFLLQGGDCAESFEDFSADGIRDTFRVMLQMATVLTFGAKKPVIKVGRIAGQFAKPRSAATEIRDGVELPSYRGDIINELTFTEEARRPNPKKMLEAYSHSAATINLLRAFASGGYANLERVASWNLDFSSGKNAARYREISESIASSLEFMSACGVNSANSDAMKKVSYYTSHEALLLPYEGALTREDSTTNEMIAGSAHMIWIGDRTRQPNGAHVEYCRGVINPIGLKCGPSLEAGELNVLLDLLNPENEPGRITLIGRFGAGKVADHLPHLIKAVKNSGAEVVWCCDPMHGNTISAEGGYKTRSFGAILQEIREFVQVCRTEDVYPGGIHLEMTGKNVTECIGGMDSLCSAELPIRYETACDPRLNANQALETAFLLTEELLTPGSFARGA